VITRPGAVLRAMVEAFATGDLSSVATVVHPDYLDHQGLDGERPIRGVDGFARVVTVARAALPGLSVEVLDLLEDGDRACARLRWTSTAGQSETIDIIRTDAGQAAEHWGAASPEPV
jgi:predicted ester cyclase